MNIQAGAGRARKIRLVAAHPAAGKFSRGRAAGSSQNSAGSLRAVSLVAALMLPLAVIVAPAATAHAAGDAKAGASKAVVCSACHGSQGISGNPLWPNLAGQQQPYLEKQIKAFRDGDRVEPTMQPFVASLSDQDVADIAAYFAGLSPCP